MYSTRVCVTTRMLRGENFFKENRDRATALHMILYKEFLDLSIFIETLDNLKKSNSTSKSIVGSEETFVRETLFSLLCPA